MEFFFLFSYLWLMQRACKPKSLWKNQAPIKVFLIRTEKRVKNWIVKTFDIRAHDWKFIMNPGHGCLHHSEHLAKSQRNFRVHKIIHNISVIRLEILGQRFWMANWFHCVKVQLIRITGLFKHTYGGQSVTFTWLP